MRSRLAPAASQVRVAVDEAGDEARAIEVHDVRFERARQRNRIRPDPDDPPRRHQDVAQAERLRSVEIRIEQELDHAREVSPRWART